MVYQSFGFKYAIYSVWIGCPTGWVVGVVVFAEVKDQQGLIKWASGWTLDRCVGLGFMERYLCKRLRILWKLFY